MCVVSMVTDHYMQKWPTVIPLTWPTTSPSYPWPQPSISITPEQWAEYLELKRKATEYDQRTGQPDCVKPGVEEWEESIKKLIDKKLAEKGIE